MSRGRGHFHPRMVPEIRNGYFWLAKDATGIGTTSFIIPEGNKRSAFNFVQATVASQPTALTANDTVQFRMRKTADSNPSLLITSGSVQAGWTTDTYVAGWFRLPDASGAITGTGNLFVHTATNQARVLVRITSPSGGTASTTPSWDGTNSGNNTFGNPFSGAGWHYIETMVFPNLSGNSPNTERVVMFSDFTLLSATNGASLANFTTLFNGNGPISLASRAAQGLANVDTTDFANIYYGNGVPNLKNRKRLANYFNPNIVHFQP